MIAYSRQKALGMIVYTTLMAAGCGAMLTILPPNDAGPADRQEVLQAAVAEAVVAVNGEVFGAAIVKLVAVDVIATMNSREAKDSFVSFLRSDEVMPGCGRFITHTRDIRIVDAPKCPPTITLIHELGHALGIVLHSTDPDSVMYAVINRDMTVEHAARSLIAELSALNLL